MTQADQQPQGQVVPSSEVFKDFRLVKTIATNTLKFLPREAPLPAGDEEIPDEVAERAMKAMAAVSANPIAARKARQAAQMKALKSGTLLAMRFGGIKLERR